MLRVMMMTIRILAWNRRKDFGCLELEIDITYYKKRYLDLDLRLRWKCYNGRIFEPHRAFTAFSINGSWTNKWLDWSIVTHCIWQFQVGLWIKLICDFYGVVSSPNDTFVLEGTYLQKNEVFADKSYEGPCMEVNNEASTSHIWHCRICKVMSYYNAFSSLLIVQSSKTDGFVDLKWKQWLNAEWK